MSLAALIAAAIALGVSMAALQRSMKPQHHEPTREDRIARCRALIEACKATELTLSDHLHELPAALVVSSHRSNAAAARHELRLLGVES